MSHRLYYGLLAAAALLLAPAQAAEPSVNPTQLYLRAREAVNALPVPAFVQFTLQDDSTRKNALLQERLRMIVRASDGHAFVRTLQSQDGNPVHSSPRVVTGAIFPTTLIYRAGDFPLTDFGLRYNDLGRPGMFEDQRSTPQPQAPDGPKTIGAVRAINPPYRLDNLGDTTVGARAVYHLGLKPIRDPGHHVLREMWIDKQSFLPVRYIAERFVADGPLSFRYLVTVNTAVIGGHLVNTDLTGNISVNRALIIHFTQHSHWTVTGISFPPSVPPWAFDPAAYAQHGSEPQPDL